MTNRLDWEKTARLQKKINILRNVALERKYKSMAESKWYFYVNKHKCSVCGKEFVSKYPTCYSCYKRLNRGNLMPARHLSSYGNGKPTNRERIWQAPSDTSRGKLYNV